MHSTHTDRKKGGLVTQTQIEQEKGIHREKESGNEKLYVHNLFFAMSLGEE